MSPQRSYTVKDEGIRIKVNVPVIVPVKIPVIVKQKYSNKEIALLS